MNPPDHTSQEQDRIRAVYQQWLASERVSAYAWHRPDVLEQSAARLRVAGQMLAATVGADLAHARVVDVGCGSGGFLRQLIDWGADPARLAGTEYQPERLALARQRTAPGVYWHLGDLDFAGDGSVTLAVANTVFSSILEPDARSRLAAEMWRIVMPGGWCMVFDFRYNNPNNAEVKRVRRRELAAWWPGQECRYRTLLLAPPVARRLGHAPHLVSALLTACVPALRSHFVYMVRKPG
ncbi:methyltransferase domain-containing protein [Massilia sp. PAMC28688]|uniref:class I SAM-dependent methyltransferase n=1 Tax=Massilia sp. PAMC28688 TaxID=2861283 RepID=UPI001C62DCA7|nr:class I SAM-dependent methyltransferase [Massilia sp. PAMC28688]QYF93526.1 methyltransferase domain-containing protein [Massilia sp. PAMC28688]